MTHTHFVSVAGLVTNAEGKILLIHSPKRGWEYPGGMVEPGETPEEALHREIQEETGVEITITGFIGLCKNVETNTVNLDFSCRYLSGALKTSVESIDVRWVPPHTALDMVTFPLTRKRLEQMLSGDDHVCCFSFRRDPFTVLANTRYPVGK